MKFLKISEIAETLQVRSETVSSWINTGKLRGLKLGDKLMRVREDDFLKFIENGFDSICEKTETEKTETENSYDEEEDIIKNQTSIFTPVLDDEIIEGLDDVPNPKKDKKDKKDDVEDLTGEEEDPNVFDVEVMEEGDIDLENAKVGDTRTLADGSTGTIAAQFSFDKK